MKISEHNRAYLAFHFTFKMQKIYGTYARGDATEDSDIDLLIVLEGKVIDRMIDIVTEMNLYGVLMFIRIQYLKEKRML